MAGALEAFAFAAKRQGKRSMPAAEWSHVLSLELGWMSPGEAKGYVEAAVAAGVLVESEDGLRVAQDPQSVEIPRGFRPDPGEAPAPVAAPVVQDQDFAHWLSVIADDIPAAMEAVEAMQERHGGHLTAEVAALLAAREQGHDVADAAARLLKPDA